MDVKLAEIKNVDCGRDKYAEESVWAWMRLNENAKNA
jgi:hypothetical protein